MATESTEKPSPLSAQSTVAGTPQRDSNCVRWDACRAQLVPALIARY